MANLKKTLRNLVAMASNLLARVSGVQGERRQAALIVSPMNDQLSVFATFPTCAIYSGLLWVHNGTYPYLQNKKVYARAHTNTMCVLHVGCTAANDVFVLIEQSYHVSC